MTTSDPTPTDLPALLADLERHQPDRDEPPYCARCAERMPCAAARARVELERVTAELEERSASLDLSDLTTRPLRVGNSWRARGGMTTIVAVGACKPDEQGRRDDDLLIGTALTPAWADRMVHATNAIQRIQDLCDRWEQDPSTGDTISITAVRAELAELLHLPDRLPEPALPDPATRERQHAFLDQLAEKDAEFGDYPDAETGASG